MKDLTKGNLFKNVLLYLLPVFATQLIYNTFNLVDSIIVGNTVGSIAFTAVGSTGSITFFVINFVIGLTSGFSVHISQKFGEGNADALRRSVATSLTLCVIVSVLSVAIFLPLCGPLLRLLNINEPYYDYAYRYLFVLFAGLPVTVFYNMLGGIIRALGDSRPSMFLSMIAAVFNVGLTYLFIVCLKMEYTGAALGTILSRAISLIASVVYFIKKYPTLRLTREDFKRNGGFACAQMKIGLPMSFQFAITAVGLMVCSGVVNSLEPTMPGVMTGNTAANKVHTFLQCMFPALGTTIANVVGQNYGAKQYGRIRKAVWIAALYGLIYFGVTLLVSLTCGKSLMRLFLGGELGEGVALSKVLEYGSLFLICECSFYPFLAILNVIRNALQSMGKSFIAMFAGAMELIARLLGAFVLVKFWGYVGACLVDPLAWVFAVVFLMTVYFLTLRAWKKNGTLQSGANEEQEKEEEV